MTTEFKLLVSLWKNYNYGSSLLTEAMGGTANEVGEFAEVLVAKYYNGVQLPASNKSADVKSAEGKTIQVKSRKIDKIRTTSLNVIRSWNFDLLVVVLFSKEGNILRAIEIDSKTAEELSKRNEHQNGGVLTTNRYLLFNPKAKDFTKQLQNLLDGKESLYSDVKKSKDEMKSSDSSSNNQSRFNISNRRQHLTPIIEFVPDNKYEFKKELLRTKKAKRTWFFGNGTHRSETWNASNITESSDIVANIKTNNTFRNWKHLGIVRVKLEIS